MDETSQTTADAQRPSSQHSAISFQQGADSATLPKMLQPLNVASSMTRNGLSADSGQQPSGGEAGTTSTASHQQSAISIQQPANSDQLSAISNQRTYTGADVQKIISDMRAEAGRRIKALEQDANTFKAKAETYEAQHAKDLEELGVYRRQSAINEVAAKYKVDAKLLDKPYLNGLEQWEDLAKTLAGIKPVTVQGAPGNIQPDSGVTHGGGTDLSRLSADELIKRGMEKRRG